ncbi:Hypothetical protein NTJ_05237 [Nesidiocoris tenuis]|uniref:Tc1-like transposase DDE domain-containing protein n=1 Tax=Nesidiocoris tenuis TaxID=355587 RepID=A0ABN7AJJ6_9HEMI|nr:Hypothetical protein NTJ_05237 [Nesidiocoris tenuis]
MEPVTPGTSRAGRNGKAVEGQARAIIFSVFQYLKGLKEQGTLGRNVVVREETAKATSYSLSTVNRIISEGNRVQTETGSAAFTTPNKPRGRPPKLECVGFADAPIRHKVLELYARKKLPTLRSLANALREDNVIDCRKDCLRERLLKLGFEWKKCQSNRKILVERPEIASWRMRYLDLMKLFRSLGRYVVYLGETCINESHHTPNRSHSPKDEGKENRLTVIHGGGELGFVPNAFLIFNSSSRNGNCHTPMNFENFSKWLKEEFLPNIPSHSVVVLSNGAYHNLQTNRKPSAAYLKEDIVTWLRDNDILFEEYESKAQLLCRVKNAQVTKTYQVDEIINEAGHDAIHLPPNHPDLNPIEMVWSDLKGQLARTSVGTAPDAKEQHIRLLFDAYTAEKWKKVCERVKESELKYMANGHLMDDRVDEMIIHLSKRKNSSGTSADVNDFSTLETD